MKVQKTRYLTLSLLSGVLETGTLIFGYCQYGLTYALLFALAYQIGCLMRNPLNLSLRSAAVLLVASCLCVPFLQTNILLITTMILFTSGGIQTAREYFLPRNPPMAVSVKRLVRVVGFLSGILLSTFAGYATLVAVSLLSCLVVLSAVKDLKKTDAWMKINRQHDPDGFGWVMFMHQIHYFTYAYVLLALFCTLNLESVTDITFKSAVVAALAFTLGWLTYISGEALLKDAFKLSPKKAIIIGHTWVTACLLVMFFYRHNPYILVMFWVLGGFGGGSVYAIKIKAGQQNSKADIELWEHYGHNAGVLAAFLSVLFFPLTPEYVFVLAAFAAVTTIILLLIVDHRFHRELREGKEPYSL